MLSSSPSLFEIKNNFECPSPNPTHPKIFWFLRSNHECFAPFSLLLRLNALSLPVSFYSSLLSSCCVALLEGDGGRVLWPQRRRESRWERAFPAEHCGVEPWGSYGKTEGRFFNVCSFNFKRYLRIHTEKIYTEVFRVQSYSVCNSISNGSRCIHTYIYTIHRRVYV